MRRLLVVVLAAWGAQVYPAPQRIVAPFPVVDEAGREVPLPFLGGLDVPRPQFVDIDADGDLDLFVQEYSNALMFFENTGSARAPKYEWRSDRFQNLEIGEWYRFVDLDADSDMDLLAERPFSHIRHYRNAGGRTSPRFEYAGPLKDTDGADLFLDRQNIPALVDIDCDNRLDLFVGRVEGTVARYEAERPGGDRFAFITEQFEGIEIIGRIGDAGDEQPSLRHGANALAFADVDGDKDFDLFWGDFFEPGMLLIENVGKTCSTPSFQVEPVPLPHADGLRTSGYNAPAPVDFDGDGDLDFLMGVLGGAFNPIMTAADNFHFWERTAPNRFERRTSRFLNGLDFGSESVPSFVDLDGDKDLDLVVGTKIDPAQTDAARLVVFMNDGTAASPRLRLAETLKLADAYHFAPAFGDLDGDGDPDLLLGTWNQDILFFRNDGAGARPRWVQDEARTIRPPRANHATPALGDIDGDRDLDLFVGQANGAITFFRNEGSPKAPRFVLVSEQQDGLRAGRRSAPAVVDVDADGLPDLVVGRESGGLAVYRNAGTRAQPKFVEDARFALSLPPMSAPAVADLDADGALDLVAGTTSGGLVFFRSAFSRR